MLMRYSDSDAQHCQTVSHWALNKTFSLCLYMINYFNMKTNVNTKKKHYCRIDDNIHSGCMLYIFVQIFGCANETQCH